MAHLNALNLTLSSWLSLEIYHTLLVFVRISAAFLLLPGVGEPAVPVRMRFLAALAVAAAITPGVAGMPATMPQIGQLITSVLAEATVGALLGGLARTVISGVMIGGQIMSQNVGLTNIFAPGLTLDESSAIGGALYAGLLAILFASHGDELILRALADSYNLLPPGRFPNMAAGARSFVAAGVSSFRLAGRLALPFLVLALLFNVSLALMNRAMPSLPVFMIANPALVLLGLYLLAATVPGLVNSSLRNWTDLSSLLR